MAMTSLVGAGCAILGANFVPAQLARSMTRPTVDRLEARLSRFENEHLDRYAILPVLALADPEAVAALVDVIPDGKEEGIGQLTSMGRG